jgi:hypothetical protein
MDQQQERVEALGPAEQIVNALTRVTDHIVHNRPGVVRKDPHSTLGVTWAPVIWKEEDGKKNVYQSQRVGRKNQHVKIGTMNGKNEVKDGRKLVGEYRKPGLFPESAAYLYRQVAEVWKMDNEFAARWASWAFPRDNRDLKVILCAFMLVQSRVGEPVIEDGEILFYDDDYRNVGEAMCLIRAKVDLNPKLLLRVGDVLNLPEIAEINRELGFCNSARNPARGRYYRVVEKWLRYREENVPMLEGLVKAGFRTTVQKLARRVGYKPTSTKFFEILRWKQSQAKDGRREMAIGAELEAAESWESKTEKQICQLITEEKPNWKRIVGLLPADIGMTQAIVAAAVEAGSMSKKDLIIMTPTFEELGLLKVKSVEKRWKAAVDQAEDQRAANIARNVKSKEAKEGLQEAVDKATEKALEEVTQDLRVYCVIDKSASMQGSLEKAQEYLTKFLGGFPLDRLHVSVFNTVGKELTIKAPKAAAVRQAFQGHQAGGGTSYAEGFKVLAKYKPKDNEDALILFVGDEEDNSMHRLVDAIQRSGINPVAFGLLKVRCTMYGGGYGSIVTDAARQLGIPCFAIEEKMFTSDDPYAVTRLLQNLIASTPVGERPMGRAAPARKTLVEEILETKLLQKPVWA